jgi:2-phosphoglycerate kinase
MNRERAWDVLLIGGASGTGKTTVAQRLAHHFGVGLTAVDDFQVVLETMTTPEQQPEIHFWRTHPDPESLTANEIALQGIEVRRAMASPLEAVIADHLEANVPVILEGDFIDPMLAVRRSFDGQPGGGRVRAAFLVETDEGQILHNFAARDPSEGSHRKRARVSWLQGQLLLEECRRAGMPAVSSRPWETLFTRVREAVTEGVVGRGT